MLSTNLIALTVVIIMLSSVDMFPLEDNAFGTSNVIDNAVQPYSHRVKRSVLKAPCPRGKKRMVISKFLSQCVACNYENGICDIDYT